MLNLKQLIIDEIEQKGPLSLARFIELSLAHQSEGYYSLTKSIGKDSDFITSPEISQLFGEIIGVWCVNLWQLIGSPADIALVELGPGNGTLISDILRITKNVDGFHNAISVHLIELNNNLRQKQRAALDQFADIKKYWHNDASNLPQKPAIFIANEFFDALPISQYIRRKDSWYAIHIDVTRPDLDLAFCEIPIDQKTHDIIENEYAHVPRNGIIEISDMSSYIIKQIADHIVKYDGGGLFIDYGYEDSNNRLFISSLQAVKSHKYHSPFADLGAVDLSSYVNFTALKDAAKLHGAKVLGQITQRQFLLNMHMKARLERLLATATKPQQDIIIKGYNRLVNPDQMGLLFKAMAITRPELNGYMGF